MRNPFLHIIKCCIQDCSEPDLMSRIRLNARIPAHGTRFIAMPTNRMSAIGRII